jgi:branched-chain amino acid transport system ATP-binding protein
MKAGGAPLLRVSGLSVRYGPIAAVRDLSLEVGSGDVVSIVGPNGAGKTSLASAIAGIVPAAEGTIRFEETDLRTLLLEDVVRAGIALVPEGRHIFPSLTVAENLALGATVRPNRAEVQADTERYLAMFPILKLRYRQPAGQLSGGEQQQLAIARALMSRPRLLILDEPSLGLAPLIVDQVYDLLRTIHESGVSILLIEQNAARTFAFADRIMVMSGGEVRLSGTPAELAAHSAFDAAYFGVGMDAVA